MATFFWKSAVGGGWGAALLWTGGVVPNDALADVTIDPVGSYTVSIPSGLSIAVHRVNDVAGAGLDIGGSLSFAGNSMLGNVTIEAGGTLDGQGLLQIGGTLTNSGVLSADVAGAAFVDSLGSLSIVRNGFGADEAEADGPVH